MRHYIKRLLICIALLTANAAAWATDYVITNGTNFLCNNNGALDNSTTFNPSTCIWKCSGTTSGTLSNNANGTTYYLRRSSFTMSLDKSNNTSWTISGNKVYSSSSSRKYYIYYYDSDYDSDGWSVTTSSGDAASIYSVNKLSSVPAASSVTVGPASKTMHQGDDCDFTVKSFSYTPAYDQYQFNNTTYNCSTDGSYSSTSTPTDITTSDVTPSAFSWATDAPTGNIALTKATEATANAKYVAKVNAETSYNVTATITVPKTGNFMTADATLSGTATITLSHLLVPTTTLTLSSHEVYIGETVNVTLNTDNTTGTVNYSLDNQDFAELNTSASPVTIKGKGVESGKDVSLVNITATVAESSTHTASSATATVTVKKHPTTLALSYDKNILSYGEAAPTLTSCVVTDTHDNSTVTGATVTYTSSDTGIEVDNTGALTIKKACTAVITATYAGDATHVKSTASFQITVNKATPTLTFPEDNYFVRFTDGFSNAPKATLDPSTAGSVTYNCASNPEGLVTVDQNTGKVTLAEVNGTMEGTATITATFAGDDKYNAVTASYDLTVSTRAIPENFSINMENSLYVEDNTHKITVDKGGSTGDVTYESSNTNVLEVAADGTMTAKKEGTADVTVKMEGDNTYIPMSVTFTVTVKRYPTKLTISGLESEYYTDSGEIPLNVSLQETVNNTGASGKTDKYI